MATPTTASVAAKLAAIPVISGYAKASVSGYEVSSVDATPSSQQAIVSGVRYYNYTINSQLVWQAEGAPATPATDYLFSQSTLTATQKSQSLVSVSTQNGPGAVPTAPNNMTVLASNANYVLLGFFPIGSGNYQTYYLISKTTQNSAVPADFPAGATLTYDSTAFSAPSPACYQAGTHLRTEHGETRVEDLRVGDRVVVIEGAELLLKPVVWIGQRRLEIASYADPAMVLPVRIRRDAFAAGVPARDLLVSPDHAIFVDGVLIQAKLLVNGGSIVQDDNFRRVHYFHVELDRHSVLLAEGLPAESYLDCGNRDSFENGGNTIALRPDFDTRRDAAAAPHAVCHPMVEDAGTVRPIWTRLAERSAALGFAAPAPATVADPALRVLAGGRELKPVASGNGRFTFVLPADATEVEVLSRSAAPSDLQPWLADHRRLGVAVSRIGVRSGSEWTDIALDGPELGQGWWAVEWAGRKAWRWTDGNASVALPATLPGESFGRLLEVQVHACMTYVVPADAGEALRAA